MKTDARKTRNADRTLDYGARRSVRRTAFGIVASAAVLSVVTLLLALPSRAATPEAPADAPAAAAAGVR